MEGDLHVQARLREAEECLKKLPKGQSLVDASKLAANIYEQVIKDPRASTSQKAAAMWGLGYTEWMADLVDDAPAWVFFASAAILDPTKTDYMLSVAREAVYWLGTKSPSCRIVVSALLHKIKQKNGLSKEQKQGIEEIERMLAEKTVPPMYSEPH